MTSSTSLKWNPSSQQRAAARLQEFWRRAEAVAGRKLPSAHDLWRWSVDDKELFWPLVWDFCGVIGEPGPVVFEDGGMPGARFFPQGKINFAENLLRRRDDAPAIVFSGENGAEETLSWQELHDAVCRLRQALRREGVGAGDRVAGYLPNTPAAVIAMLAAASLGAVWASASPDFGVEGVLDRFAQIEPKVLFAAESYVYNGKRMDMADKIRTVGARLPSLKKTVIVPYPGVDAPGATWDDFIRPFAAASDEVWERFDFNAPLYILFSSGTTGAPKCIVHGAGGTLLQHLKEHQLHSDIRAEDRVFYFTTCGWMMWNWLVSALASEATLVLYDGSPFSPGPAALFRLADKHRCSFFGVSAKYIDALRNARFVTRGRFALQRLRTVASTGSPLSHENFDYIYSELFPGAHLASISGGTDIVSCFVLGNPLLPVHRGEIQGPGLGMDVDVFDAQGQPQPVGAAGELVCKTPFPAMPVKFWNDPDGAKYRKAYFERFPGVWHHGDWCEKTAHGGFVIHGRSDATLNPGGVRIGTAEIYRIVDAIPGIRESLAVGQDWKGDVRVVLFVVLQDDAALTPELCTRIAEDLKIKASPRHVPAKIIAVAELPRTKSGKVTELAVRDILHGRAVTHVEALANPEALRLFENLEDLRT